MRFQHFITALILAICLSTAELRAQAPAQPGDAVKAMVGTWEISNADRDKICIVALKADAAAGAFKLEFDKAACVPNLPMMKDVVLWKVGADDAVQLLDGKGRTLVEFTEVETGMYNTERPGEGVFFLQTPGAAGPPPRTADQMVGDWTMVRGANKPICTLTLSNTTTALDDFVLKINPGCDAFVTRFGPTTWQMDRGELLLKSPRGQTWRFEEGDDNKWERVPETADPVRLVRP
jgi:Protease inhibitor Inh